MPACPEFRARNSTKGLLIPFGLSRPNFESSRRAKQILTDLDMNHSAVQKIVQVL